MTRVMILGGAGMLGHKACQVLSRTFDTYATFRTFSDEWRQTGVYDETKVLTGIDIAEFSTVQAAIDRIEPQLILNCIGVIKQLPDARNPRLAIYTNALFPHLLAEHCTDRGIRLIHISTDCVFSGKTGAYVESDVSDAEDLYGRTKYLGELDYGSALTLRTSIVGHGLFPNRSLIDWFLSQEGTAVKGYTNAIYSGFPTIVLCEELARVAAEYPRLTGLYHVSSDPITKYDLLCHVRDIYGVDIEVVPDEHFRCDRSLNSDKYRKDLAFTPLEWREMIAMMYADSSYYTCGTGWHDLHR